MIKVLYVLNLTPRPTVEWNKQDEAWTYLLAKKKIERSVKNSTLKQTSKQDSEKLVFHGSWKFSA